MTKESLKLLTDEEIETTKAFLKNSWQHSEKTDEFKEEFKKQLNLLNVEIHDSRPQMKQLSIIDNEQ